MGEAKGEPKEVTRQDRVKFSQLVNQLTSDQLGHVVGVLQRQCPEALNEVNPVGFCWCSKRTLVVECLRVLCSVPSCGLQEDDDELEIEINNIDAATLLALNNYGAECVASGSAKKKRR